MFKANCRARLSIFRNTVSDLLTLMLVAVFVTYAVLLAILYESYLHVQAQILYSP